MTQKHSNYDHPISVALREWAESSSQPAQNSTVARRRKMLANGKWDKAAASSEVPIEIKKLMIATTDQKGTLYNILSDQRMSWEDLKTVYEQVGATTEAKLRLLLNRGSNLPSLLEWVNDYDKKLTPLLFSRRGIPVSAFLDLMAEYGRRMEAWEKENAGEGFSQTSPVRYRQDNLGWFIEAAQKWVSKHPSAREVATALNSVEDFYGRGEEVLASYFSRQDATWDVVRSVNEEGDYTGFVADGFFAVKASRVPKEELEEVAKGGLEATPRGRIHCLIAAYSKDVPELLEALDVLLVNRPGDDFTEALHRIGSNRYVKRRVDVGSYIFTDGATAAERLILSNSDKSLARGLGFFSFKQSFENIKELNRKIAEGGSPSASPIRGANASHRLLWALEREQAELVDVIATATGSEAYRAWMEANHPEMVDIPLEWALEVLT